jgi:hypothetical protein
MRVISLSCSVSWRVRIALMKRGKELRDAKGQATKPEASKDVPVLMFVMVEKAPGAFTLRLVCNEDVLGDIRKQGALNTFLIDIDELYATSCRCESIGFCSIIIFVFRRRTLEYCESGDSIYEIHHKDSPLRSRGLAGTQNRSPKARRAGPGYAEPFTEIRSTRVD